jgi:hypothetical protein
VEFDVRVAGEGQPVQLDEANTPPSRIESREGVVRHIESSIYVDVDVAKRLVEWLNARILESESRR